MFEDLYKVNVNGHTETLKQGKTDLHWYRGYGENKCLEFADIPLEPNDFCSRGERKDDET